MKVVALLNEKGGSGKTTVSLNLATAMHRQGKKVVLVDADPQGTLRDWRAASPEGANLPPVVALDRPQMLGTLDTINADFVVIDTPGKADTISAMAIRKANVALIIIQASAADIWAAAATVKMINTRIELGGKLDVAFLVNRVIKNTRLTREILGGEWNEYKIDQLTATVGNRTVFAQSLSDGLSVYDHANAEAKAEIDAILAEMEAARWL